MGTAMKFIKKINTDFKNGNSTSIVSIYDIENCLKAYKKELLNEKNILKIIDKMCVQSLSPGAFEKWGNVKKQLISNRKKLKPNNNERSENTRGDKK